MLLGLLTVSLAALLVLSLLIFDRELANPSFVYLAGFFLSSTCALLFSSSWQFTLHYQAFLVILLGSLCFVGVCYLCKYLVRLRGRVKGDHVRGSSGCVAQSIRIPFLPVYAPLIVAYTVFGIIVIAWTLAATVQLYPADTLSGSISARKYSATFTTDSGSFFFPLNQLRSLYSAAGYVVTYLVAQEFARKRLSKCPILLISYIMLLAFMLTDGARTGLANNLAVLIVCYLLIIGRGGEEGMRKLSRRTVVVLIGAVVAFLLGYQFLAIGRGSGGFSFDNLGAYLGAEISNLDAFLQTSGRQDTGIFGYMTFVRTINYLGGLFGIGGWIYPLDLPFLSSNGHWMGNVYGTYYAFIYDFGYAGVPVLTAIMAFASEVVYEYARRGNKNAFTNTLIDIVYGYMACNLLFCFFSNRFYENVISINFARFFVYAVVSLAVYMYLPKCFNVVKKRFAARRVLGK